MILGPRIEPDRAHNAMHFDVLAVLLAAGELFHADGPGVGKSPDTQRLDLLRIDDGRIFTLAGLAGDINELPGVEGVLGSRHVRAVEIDSTAVILDKTGELLLIKERDHSADMDGVMAGSLLGGQIADLRGRRQFLQTGCIGARQWNRGQPAAYQRQGATLCV